MNKAFQSMIGRLSSPHLLHYTLPLVMVYLLVGTIAQKYIGLYEATRVFFSSWVMWAGFVPLPGLPVLLALIYLNLTFKLVFKSPWTKANSGIIITHIAALLLLTGGLLTALFSHENYLDLAEGEIKSSVKDYHAREMVISGGTDHRIRFSELKAGETLRPEGMPLSLEILEICGNCEIKRREDAHESYQGMAKNMKLVSKPPERENERNMAGITIRVVMPQGEETHTVLEDIPVLPKMEIEGQTYEISLSKLARDLPFQVQLLDFKREMHPGTGMAKSYSSTVRILDGDSRWESVISMNEPLRYKGYTFFQSSYIETPDGDVSVLAVVWNAGRAFPYISGLAMCLGIIVHLFVRRKSRKGSV